MGTKERLVWILLVFIAGGMSYFAGHNQSQARHGERVSVEVVSENTDVSNEIDKSFGWSKGPANMNIEAVDMTKGTRPGGDEYPHPMPAVKLALKNNGHADLDSFGINILILDELNKRRIATYGQASGSIKQGWTSEKILFSATEADWSDIIGKNKIDFPVTMLVYASANGGDKDILRIVFDPLEIDSLPELNH